MSEKLNVCLINDSFPPEIDGVANAVTNYAAIINGSLGRSCVVTPAHPKAHDSDFYFPVVRYPSIDLTKQVGYYAGLPFSPAIMQELTEKRFDVIHTHCPISSTMIARMLRDRTDVPVVFTYHTKFDIDIANAVKGRLLQDGATKLLVENISACDEVWTVSRGAGENLRKLGFQGKYRVMPNGVDIPKGIVSDELIKKATEGFDLPYDAPVFLFVGRMMWYKGIRIILDALKTLQEKGQNFRMVFVGGGADRDDIVEYTEKLGLSGKVLFSEPIHERDMIRSWYCRANLFLFPSTFDTNGLVVREAAACALGSVLIKGSCAAEDVTDGVSGFLIEENAEAMAAKLIELCRTPDVMARVGKNARDSIYMSWEESVNAAYSRYYDVIDNYRRGLYPPHIKFTDELFRVMAESLGSYSRIRQLRRERLDGIREHAEKLRSESEWIADDYRQILIELELGKEYLRMNRECALRRIHNQIDEMNDRIDRFL